MSNDKVINDSLIKIGSHIKKLRTTKKLSGYSLGIMSEVSSSVIARIEKGQREPRLSTLLKIIEGLEMTPAEFFNNFNERLLY